MRLETSDLLLSCPTFWLGCRYKQHTELHIVYRTLTLWATSICSTLLVHHFIISGWKGVKDTLAGLAQQHGVEIKTNVAVEEVIVSGGRAVGVKLQGGVEESLGADQLAIGDDWWNWKLTMFSRKMIWGISIVFGIFGRSCSKCEIPQLKGSAPKGLCSTSMRVSGTGRVSGMVWAGMWTTKYWTWTTKSCMLWWNIWNWMVGNPKLAMQGKSKRSNPLLFGIFHLGVCHSGGEMWWWSMLTRLMPTRSCWNTLARWDTVEEVEPVMLALCWWGQHLQIGHFHYNV